MGDAGQKEVRLKLMSFSQPRKHAFDDQNVHGASLRTTRSVDVISRDRRFRLALEVDKKKEV